MKLLIVANWKMNPQTLKGAKLLFDSVEKGVENIKNIEVIICPPFLYIPKIQDTRYKIQVGAQDCFWEEKGAFTGEISTLMLKNLGCQYVIIGHSERRRYLKETDEMVNKKLKAALKNNLTPILCVENILQVKEGLKGILKEDLKNVVIAYEPVFAIGTGKPCSPQKAEKMRRAIKSATDTNIPILYGGSVNSQNASGYIEKAEFQGLLVGGASLNAGEFVKIVRNVAALHTCPVVELRSLRDCAPPKTF